MHAQLWQLPASTRETMYTLLVSFAQHLNEALCAIRSTLRAEICEAICAVWTTPSAEICEASTLC